MQDNLTINNGILDIVVPGAPKSDLLMGLLPVILAAFIVLVGIYVWRTYFSKKGKARIRLERLQYLRKNNIAFDKQTVFQLANIIKDGFSFNCMTQEKLFPCDVEVEKESWKLFLRKLDNARYSNHKISSKEMNHLFLEAKRWLK